MRLFDTHCHFESDNREEICAILRRAKEAGVDSVMAVGGSEALNRSAILALAVGARYCALGYDREQINVSPLPIIAADRPSQIAWGEIGLDYYYSSETRQAQLSLFESQLEIARQRDLPVVIHTREADDDTLALLRSVPSRGIIHCYTGTPEAARKYLDLGFYISISGIVTFRRADNVRETARMIPDDRILIETDSPFLAPIPMRGKPNEPAFLRYTCEFLAQLRNKSVEEFAELTYCNAERILR